MIQVENLSKAYGMNHALKNINFEVKQGEIVGLLGANGAGKSTTIKILTGYLHPDSGRVQVDGLDVVENPQAVQARLGYLPENTPLYPDLSVQAYLKLIADMRNIPTEQQAKLISNAIISTNLQDHRARPIGHLSKGLRQRVGLAQAILHQPKLLILDEPTIGLDPTQILEIRHLIRRLAEHSTILFSSHILPEVQALCDRVIILMNGEIKADARIQELADSANIILVLQTAPGDVKKKLLDLEGVEKVDLFQTPEGFPAYRIASQADLSPKIYDLARSETWALRELRRDTVTLETIFNELATAG